MNASTGTGREWEWQPLGLVELQAVQGGSPTLPLPPPGASLSSVFSPFPWPWSVEVLPLGGAASHPTL
jgi:hypothetical protein